MKKLIIILFFILEPLMCLANNPFLEKESNVNSLKKAKNTFIFWINGDTDRFRPSEGIESKNIRIDTLDAKKIRDYSLNCNCNVVLFHDQRFSDKWYTSEKHFGAFIYAYSSGREVNFKFQVKRKKSSGIKGRNKSEVIDVWKNALSFNEIDQNKQFLINLLEFTKVTFPDTKYHLVFRGHFFC